MQSATELCRPLIRRRRRGAHRRQALSRAGGVISWKAPYGYRRVPRSADAPPRLEPYEPEAAVVRRIFDDYVAGGHSTREITRRLNADGVPTPTGPGRCGAPQQSGASSATRPTWGGCTTTAPDPRPARPRGPPHRGPHDARPAHRRSGPAGEPGRRLHPARAGGLAVGRLVHRATPAPARPAACSRLTACPAAGRTATRPALTTPIPRRLDGTRAGGGRHARGSGSTTSPASQSSTRRAQSEIGASRLTGAAAAAWHGCVAFTSD